MQQSQGRTGQTGRYRGVPASERAADRRARLLQATLSVWADPQVRTTMTAVCATAKLSERYFYESFAGLPEAQRAVLEMIAVEFESTALAAAQSAGPLPEQRIRALLRAFAQLIADDPRKGRVAIIEASSIPELRPRRTELLRHFAELATDQARAQGVSSPERPADPLAGLMFIGGLAEVVTAWLDGSLTTTVDAVVETATKTYLSLYL